MTKSGWLTAVASSIPWPATLSVDATESIKTKREATEPPKRSERWSYYRYNDLDALHYQTGFCHFLSCSRRRH